MATVKNLGDPHSKIEPHIPSPAQARTLFKDGVTAPSTIAGYAQLYVDAADGDLKVKFGDGFTAVVQADS